MRVASGTRERSVKSACASAEPHLQARPAGMRATAVRTTLQAFSAFFVRLPIMSLTVTASWPRMPAIVIRHHRHGHVADLGLAREFGLLQIGHADHVHAPASVHVGFGLGRKGRALHAKVGAAVLGGDADRVAGAGHHFGELGTDRIGEADVGYQAFSEERGDAAAGAIEELVGDDEIQRPVLLLERAHGAERNDALHAQQLHAVNVGPEIQLRGQQAVASAMTGEERHVPALQRAEHVVVRGPAEGRLDVRFFLRFKPGHGVKPAAADDANFRFQFSVS